MGWVGLGIYFLKRISDHSAFRTRLGLIASKFVEVGNFLHGLPISLMDEKVEFLMQKILRNLLEQKMPESITPETNGQSK